ncbi:MAG: uroporphyrinogen decarboxylase family protein [Acidobacteriota bacterium]
MSPRERVLAALGRKRVSPLPVGAVTQSASVWQMETLGIRWPEAHSDPRLMAALAEGAHTLVGFDMVRVPFDQTVEAGLLGAEVDYGDQTSNCSLRSHPLKLGDSLPPFPDLGVGRARVVIEAIRLLRARTDAAVIGGLVGPFTLVCQLAGISNVLMAAARQPDRLLPYLDFAVQLGTDYARRQVDAGADAICIEDMSASLDLTSPRIYQSLILPAQQKLIAAIPAPVILHICGSNTKILALLFQTGAAALSLEDRTDLAAAAAGPCAIIGGIHPIKLGQSPISPFLDASLAAGVHILAPGCGIEPATPVENLREMVRVARTRSSRY